MPGGQRPLVIDAAPSEGAPPHGAAGAAMSARAIVHRRSPAMPAGSTTPPHRPLRARADSGRVKAAVGHRVPFGCHLGVQSRERASGRRRSWTLAATALAVARRAAMAGGTRPDRGLPRVTTLLAAPPKLACRARGDRRRVHSMVTGRIKLPNKLRVQRRQGAPRTHPRRSRLDRNPNAFAEPAVLINKLQSARPKPPARTPRAARLLHRKPERIPVLGKRPAMRETEMSAADRSEPTAAQVALHLVLIGVIGQLAEPPEVCRAVVDPQGQVIQHDDGFNHQQSKPEIDRFEPATTITTMTCSTSPPAQTSTTASPQSRNKLVDGSYSRLSSEAALMA